MYRLSKTSLLGWITVWHSPCEITFVNEAILKDRQRREIGHPSPSFEILLTQNIDADSDNLWRFHHFYGDCLLLPVNSASPPAYPAPPSAVPVNRKWTSSPFQGQLLSHWNWPQLSRRPDVCMYMVSGIDGTNRRNNWDEERLWSIERGKMKFSRNLKTCSIKKVENDRFVRFKFSSLYNSIRMRMFNGECLIQSEN